jgi:glycosyltransferase involved in cell wall biosynthesis
MRYLWNMYHDYAETAGFLKRMMMPPLTHYLRAWDVSTASRVDSFVANSRTVAQRIKRYYNADSTVIYPPVDTEAYAIAPASELEDYYLMAGELVSYKRPDLAVQAFNKMKRNLVVIGGGPMLEELRKMAGPTVKVLGSQPFDVLRQHYARCRALIFPGEEDFGMVPVETMASGRPVLAFGKGGAVETVIPGLSGELFYRQTTDAIIEAVEALKPEAFDPAAMAAHAATFGTAQFATNFGSHVDRLVAARSAAR